MKLFTRKDEPRRRRSAWAVGGALSLFVLSLTTATPAQAYSSSCIAAPGTYGAKVCIAVDGRSTQVDRIRSSYGIGVSVWGKDAFLPPSLCQRKHEVLFTRAGSDHEEVLHGEPTSCVNPIPMIDNDWYDFDELAGAELADGSHVCTRVNNPATGNTWSPWVCVDMKADGWGWW